MASIAWRMEPDYVKRFYKELEKKTKAALKKTKPFYFTSDKKKKKSKVQKVNNTVHVPQLDILQKNAHDNYSLYMSMSDSDFVNCIPDDLALTYKALMNSIPY
ncbi:2312_t:CDS:1 [Acaulospora colombiana]|uniref:2312_t:CDS:1 n=1 Tax=Acaulospora colombiana TaxID=27376 RepID=A0ACA9JV70_9GLOM|nr:2312_t:CDS:1 [Acaulospora colombiana]